MKLKKPKQDSSQDDQREEFEKRPDMVALDILARRVIKAKKQKIKSKP